MIQTQIILTPDDKIQIRNWRTVLMQLKEEGITLFDLTIRRPFEQKTSDQLGFLYGEVAIKAMHGYRKLGHVCRTKEAAVEKLCYEEDIDFCDRVTDSKGNVYRKPKSIASSSLNEIYQFIHLSIIFIESELMMEVNPPTEFKKFYDEKIFRANAKTKI
jgi:hypothetical protein